MLVPSLLVGMALCVVRLACSASTQQSHGQTPLSNVCRGGDRRKQRNRSGCVITRQVSSGVGRTQTHQVVPGLCASCNLSTPSSRSCSIAFTRIQSCILVYTRGTLVIILSSEPIAPRKSPRLSMSALACALRLKCLWTCALFEWTCVLVCYVTAFVWNTRLYI